MGNKKEEAKGKKPKTLIHFDTILSFLEFEFSEGSCIN